ncbi:MAG: PLDc_N domain-containing protein, partial [Actinobacteria bacterium]|nr:PLDc_N domain-containing protein [Actinomycetota bacterium]
DRPVWYVGHPSHRGRTCVFAGYGGWAKAGWALVILLIPLLGTLIYLGMRPSDAREPL